MQAIDRARAPRSPLYLASTPRSGATLLAAMLNRHRHIAMFNEPWFFQLAAKYGSLRRRPNVRRLLNDLSYSGRGFGAAIEDDWLSEIEAEILAAGDDRPLAGFLHFLDRFAALQGKPRWGVKQPHGILDAPHLLRQRPDIRFVHIVRDPRSTVAYRMGKSDRTEGDLVGALRFARSWRQLCTFADRVAALGPENTLEVLYEDLVREPETVLRQICRFLNEDYDDTMLTFYRAEKPYVPQDRDGRPKSTHTGVLSAVYTHEIDAWKELLAPRELELVEHVCAAPMAARAYSLRAETRQLTKRTLALTHWRLRWRLLRTTIKIDLLGRLFQLGRRGLTALQPMRRTP